MKLLLALTATVTLLAAPAAHAGLTLGESVAKSGLLGADGDNEVQTTCQWHIDHPPAGAPRTWPPVCRTYWYYGGHPSVGGTQADRNRVWCQPVIWQIGGAQYTDYSGVDLLVAALDTSGQAGWGHYFDGSNSLFQIVNAPYGTRC